MRTTRQITAKANHIAVCSNGLILGKIPEAKNIIMLPEAKNIIMLPEAKNIIMLPEAKNNIVVKKDNIIIKFTPENIKGEYLVTNSNGYNMAQLKTPIPKYDYECIELYGKNLFQDADTRIPVNYGLGIEIEYEGTEYITKRGGSSWRSKPTISLETRSWKGISCGAIHYYGDLHINLPEMVRKDKDGYSHTCHYFPMFNNNKIILTLVLEQWEIDKYPSNYEYFEVGSNHNGFYTLKQLKDYAKEVFEKIFAIGWQFRYEEE
jgi:hypothetical protein